MRVAPIGLLVVAFIVSPVLADGAAGPTRIANGSTIFIEQTEFGLALSAAILKQKVPVSVITDEAAADYRLNVASAERREKTGERVAKILMFGVFAGSGKHFDAMVTIVNRQGTVVFGHNAERGTYKKAANNVAKKLRQHVTGV